MNDRDALPAEIAEAEEGTPWQVIYAAFAGFTLCAFGLFGGVYLLAVGDRAVVFVIGGAAIVAAVAIGVACAALLTGARWSLHVCRAFAVVAVASLLAATVVEIVRTVRLRPRAVLLRTQHQHVRSDLRAAVARKAGTQQIAALEARAHQSKKSWFSAEIGARNANAMAWFLGAGALLAATMSALLFRPVMRVYCSRTR